MASRRVIRRRAHAGEASVIIQVGGDVLVARLGDDGVGIPESGLRNVRQRAGTLGGSFTTAPRPGGGPILN
jgi:signal transduction histidine kinase